jgi:hypothetical protein
MVVKCCDLQYDLFYDSMFRNTNRRSSIITAYMLGNGFSFFPSWIRRDKIDVPELIDLSQGKMTLVQSAGLPVVQSLLFWPSTRMTRLQKTKKYSIRIVVQQVQGRNICSPGSTLRPCRMRWWLVSKVRSHPKGKLVAIRPHNALSGTP